jgi:diguanylate cyclase (GGDEF)-like protein
MAIVFPAEDLMPVNLDPHTLLISLVLTNVLMALSLYSAALGRNRNEKGDGIAKWAVAVMLEALAWALIATRGVTPDFFSVVVAHGVKAGVHALVLAAIYEFQQRPWPRRQCLVPVGLVLLMAFLLVDDQRGRFVWGSLIYAFQLLLIGRALLQARETRGGRASKLLFRGVLVLLAVLAMRAVSAWFGWGVIAQPFSVGTPNPQQLLSYVVFLATTLLGSVGFVLMVKERSDREIMHLAMTDSLTQVYNRHALMERAEQLLARREGQALAFLMMDVDHFKVINDTYGHPTGDAVLRQVAGLLESRLRRSDIIGRYGGEEFCVIAPDIAEEGALALAESLREIMASRPVPSDQGPISMTVSVGVSLCPYGSRRNLKDVLEEADAALYEAKQEGRNRVVLFAESNIDDTGANRRAVNAHPC